MSAARWWVLGGLLAVLCWLGLRKPRVPPVRVAADVPVRKQSSEPRTTSAPAPAAFVGSERCAGCHAQEYSAWRRSQHARAMQEANEHTVLGDFAGARLAYAGKLHYFQHDAGKYWITTDGADGVFRRYQVLYTFGVEPLQQYLVAAPGGRLQVLPFAWDSRPKTDGGQRWYHLHAAENIAAGDVLHWTSPSHNWNHMCAECHSTRVTKGYDPQQDSFETTWSEISVGCEGCHGGGARHLEWAATSQGSASKGNVAKSFDVRFDEREAAPFSVLRRGTRTRQKAASSGAEASVCAFCHARRETLAQPFRHGAPLLDSAVPELLTGPAYTADGVMNDEVFTYGSFLQSKMGQAGVTCSDCHEPHAGELRAPGNAVCAQCHDAARFDDVRHHRHAPGTRGSQCAECHMPARTYMGVDVRHDHGFRVPRPDLSVRLGLPNSCTDCHADRRPEWAARAIERWLGRPAHSAQGYAELFAQARAGADVAAELRALAADERVPNIARATALSHLRSLPSAESLSTIRSALGAPDPLLRRAALGALEAYDPRRTGPSVAPLLADPVLAVRVEAARVLAGAERPAISEPFPGAFDRARTEYIATQTLHADRAESQNNGGVLALREGDLAAAERAFERALRLSPAYAATYVNLADVRRRQGRDAEGLSLLVSARARLGDNAEILHALGLALVRQGKKSEALELLQRAAQLDPHNARFAYVFETARAELGGPRR